MHKAVLKVFVWMTVLCLFTTSCTLVPAERTVGNMKTESTKTGLREWPVKGWAESTPAEQDMDASALAKADAYIKSDFPNVYSLLVVRNGYLVYEKYYQGMSGDTVAPVFSITKSIVSALTGIAIREKYLTGVDQKVSDIFPEYFKAGIEQDKREIDIEQLLTMTSGIESDSNDLWELFGSSNWLSFVTAKPLASKPGTRFNYSTGAVHLLSGVLARASAMSTFDLAKKYLFAPLGITNVNWDKDPQGYYYGGHGLYMSPRDMAKIGYLYLNNGYWDGRQIVPEEWVKESTREKVKVDQSGGYGYLWWLPYMKGGKDGRNMKVYTASGYGNQYIDVIPEYDMVVVITANPIKGSKDGADAQEIVKRYIITSVKNSK